MRNNETVIYRVPKSVENLDISITPRASQTVNNSAKQYMSEGQSERNWPAKWDFHERTD